MLTKQQVFEIKRLLDEGELSQRRIAVHVKVSRGSVAAIANGKRGLFGREHEGDLFAQSDHAERCPGCGHKVYVPCVYCRALDFSTRKKSGEETTDPFLINHVEDQEPDELIEESTDELTLSGPLAEPSETEPASPPASQPADPPAWKQCA